LDGFGRESCGRFPEIVVGITLRMENEGLVLVAAWLQLVALLVLPVVVVVRRRPR